MGATKRFDWPDSKTPSNFIIYCMVIKFRHVEIAKTEEVFY